MPWAKKTYELTTQIYKEFLPKMLERRNGDLDLVIKELLIRAEILKHDFTKRQLTILMFIITFSFNYGKPSAYVPKLSDFEIAGIHRSKIKKELTKLIDMNIIEWNQEDHEFSIIEARFWKDVPYNYDYNDDRSRQLFFLNLEHAGIDIQPILEKLKKMEP